MELPSPFIDAMQRLLGASAYAEFEAALQDESPVCVRLNRDKPIATDRAEWREVPWCPNGFYLPQRPTFTFDPLFHAGSYYVQEASSMFLSQVMRTYVSDPSVVLDLCAAPGGKSTLLRSVLPEGSLLVANEVMRQRSQVLAENITKWGHPATVVTHNDPADFASLHQLFDVILTDVPCSGEGMFRKDPVAVQEWSPENVTLCWQRQQRILRDVWNCLKPGGLLIYSTCTFNTQENEENILWLQQTYGAEPLVVPTQPQWGIGGSLLKGCSLPVYRFLPHITRGEGLFMAVLRKPQAADDTDEPSSKSLRKVKNKRDKTKPQAVPSVCKEWLKSPDNYLYKWQGDALCAWPLAFAPIIERLNDCLQVLCAGVELGNLKGRDVIPSHALALSTQRNPNAFSTFKLTYEQAIAYLRREAITLSTDAPKGYVLLTYHEAALGFVKNIGNRANNLYPQEWRIRSGFLPDEVRTL